MKALGAFLFANPLLAIGLLLAIVGVALLNVLY